MSALMEAAALSGNGRVEVSCPDCGRSRMLDRASVRRSRFYQDGVCQPCGTARANRNRTLDRRDGPQGNGPIRVVEPDYRNYWLKRYSLDEIRELAAGLFDLPLHVKAEPSAQPQQESAPGSNPKEYA